MDRSSLWNNRSFVSLFTAQVISLLGSGVTTIGLTIFVYKLAGSQKASIVIGQALMLRILAFLLFSQPAGVLADRWNRKSILISADIARFALLSMFPFLTAVWQVYAMIFAINALTAFFSPTFEATLPEIAGKNQYVQALSLSRVASDIEAVGSPAVAALLVALMSLRWVFWFDAFTYLVSAALVAIVVIPRTRQVASALSMSAFLSEITTGTRILLREAALRKALLLSLAEATAGAAAIVLTVTYVRSVLGKSETVFALAMAAVGLGSSAMAVVLNRVTGRSEKASHVEAELHAVRHRWTGRALILGGTILAAVLLPGILKPPLWLFALLWIGNGAGQALIAIPSSTLLAEHTKTEERGRAYAAHFALTHACWLFTYPAAGWAGMRLGPGFTFTIFGCVCAAIVLISTSIGSPEATPHTHALF
ncbi:MAG: MFS transporter [Acidobacteriaceae bacterium]